MLLGEGLFVVLMLEYISFSLMEKPATNKVYEINN
jgi:hypothetical protein